MSLASPDAPNATRIAASLNLVAVVGGVAIAALFMPGLPANSSVSRVVEPVRVVGAPGADKACNQQTWPYIDARCLKRAPTESKPATAAVKPGDLSPLTAPAAAPEAVPPDVQPQPQPQPQLQPAQTQTAASENPALPPAPQASAIPPGQETAGAVTGETTGFAEPELIEPAPPPERPRHSRHRGGYRHGTVPSF